jgi:hypothetical protein
VAIVAFVLLIISVSLIHRRRQAHALTATIALQKARAAAGETGYVYGVGSGVYAQVAGGAPMHEQEHEFGPGHDSGMCKAEAVPIELHDRRKPVVLSATVHPGELGAWERY